MSMRDLHNQIKATAALNPVAATTDNTAYVSAIVDTLGFDSVEFIGIFGAIADADVTFTVLFEEGDAANLSDNAAVADADLLGIEAMVDGSGHLLRYDSDNKVFKIGYKGNKRYCRVTITPASNSGNIFLAGIWLQGHPKSAPQTLQVN